jgi:hypothetical protein
MATPPAAPLAARFALAYEHIGRGVLGDAFWQEHGAAALAHVAATLPPSPPGTDLPARLGTDR